MLFTMASMLDPAGIGASRARTHTAAGAERALIAGDDIQFGAVWHERIL
jgi:uncharacterized protein (DUF2345 family)